MAAGFKTATVRSADVPATQTDFPTYVDLARLGVTTLAEAQSVRVYANEAKTTEWAREIVSLTEMHVKVPSLTSSAVIYVDWDGVRADYGVGATYGRNAVWSNGFQAVFHLQEDPTASAPQFADSTGNGRNLTAQGSMTSGDSVAGKLNGQAIDFDGSNDALRNTTWTWGGNAVTLTGWSKSKTPNQGSDWVGFHSGTGQRFANHGPWSDGVWYWDYGTVPGTGRVSTSYTSYNDAWTHVALVSSGSANTFRGIYFNGVLANSIAGSNQPSPAPSNFAVGSADTGRFNKGEIDEVRIADGVRTANWITTEYNNQNAEATFWGTWTDAGGGGFNPAFAHRRLLL